MDFAERMRLFLKFSRKRSPRAETVHPKPPETVLGFNLRVDPTMPKDEIRMYDYRGRLVSRITGIKEPDE
jgi:hypothetical protein